jgi:hypothetical protein
MKKLQTLLLGIMATATPAAMFAQTAGSGAIKHVMLISIDGMHALDYLNCSAGVGGTAGTPTCPNLVALGQTGVNYLQASTSKPSDSFPGLAALVTGASPRNSGFFYDVSYDRTLSPPATTTPYGIVGGAGLCPSQVGTQVGFDEEIDTNYMALDGGGGINPAYLPRDPKNGCAPVYPHQFLKSNTFFEVVKANGGYTAWSDKHPAYDYVQGPSGKGVDDLWSPEINSNVVALPNVPGCSPIPDQGADLTAWTNSFKNIQCYDTLKVQAVLNWIDGKTHDGSATAPVPTVFGMNFQAVSVGEKLVEKSIGTTGGYLDALGTPSPSLLSEIQFVDGSIGKFVTELKKQGLLSSTLIIITAKHGQSPIDPAAVNRIPADNSALQSPATLLGSMVAQSSEDDVSLIWLNDSTQTAAAVAMLSKGRATTGGGEIFAGTALSLMFNAAPGDARTPDIIVTPDIGTIYTGGKGKVSEHGGFANDDTNVIMLVSNPTLSAGTWTAPVKTTQVAQTIVSALGINPSQLQSSQTEGTEVLPTLGLNGTPQVVIKAVAPTTFAKDVTLDASGSTDPAGNALTFLWTNPTHNGVILDPTSATPNVQLTTGGQYQFAVTVTNSLGYSASGSVSFTYLGH